MTIDTQVFPTLEAALLEFFAKKESLIVGIKGKYQTIEDDKGNQTTIIEDKFITNLKIQQHEIL